MGKKNLSRVGRKDAIRQAFIAHRIATGKVMMTVAQIARKMGLEPSTHLRKIVHEMVADGHLSFLKIDDPNEIAGFRVHYCLTKQGEKYHQPKPRQIVINGQKSLW